jgi:hypothetical protein
VRQKEDANGTGTGTETNFSKGDVRRMEITGSILPWSWIYGAWAVWKFNRLLAINNRSSCTVLDEGRTTVVFTFN